MPPAGGPGRPPPWAARRAPAPPSSHRSGAPRPAAERGRRRASARRGGSAQAGEPHQLTLHRTKPERRDTARPTSSLHTPPARTATSQDTRSAAVGHRPGDGRHRVTPMLDPRRRRHPVTTRAAQARDRARRALGRARAGRPAGRPRPGARRRCGRTGAAPGPAPGSADSRRAREALGALHREETLEVAVLVTVERDPERFPRSGSPHELVLSDPRCPRRTPDSDARLSSSRSTSAPLREVRLRGRREHARRRARRDARVARRGRGRAPPGRAAPSS
mgnify:CR=1 FL=1